MEGFTIIDAGVAAIVIISGVLAYSRGFVRETMAIAGWIGAAVVAFIFADSIEPLIRQIPVLGDFIGDSCELSIIGAFAAVFAIALVVFSIFTPLFASIVKRSALGGIDQAAGFLFGVLRGLLLVAIAFFIYKTVLPSQEIALIEESRSAEVFRSMAERIDDRDPEAALGWITQQYEQLVGQCGAPAEPSEPVTPSE